MPVQTEIERLEAELGDVRAAIKAVLQRGQAIGAAGRTLTRADLRWLRKDEALLEKKLARARRGGIPMHQLVPRG